MPAPAQATTKASSCFSPSSLHTWAPQEHGLPDGCRCASLVNRLAGGKRQKQPGFRRDNAPANSTGNGVAKEATAEHNRNTSKSMAIGTAPGIVPLARNVSVRAALIGLDPGT